MLVFQTASPAILTEGGGTHSAQFSPDRRFLIDTWSRVDQPPVIELRRGDDGSLLCKLEEADASELFASGWKAPEPFVAKGRDGETDIYGVIFRPADFDASKKISSHREHLRRTARLLYTEIISILLRPG